MKSELKNKEVSKEFGNFQNLGDVMELGDPLGFSAAFHLVKMMVVYKCCHFG